MSAAPLDLALFEAPHRVAMGLKRLAADEPWLLLDTDRAADLREKARLVDEQRAQVFVERPGSRPAQAEAAAQVDAWLAERHPDFASAGPTPEGSPPLLGAALRVQEDLCVMEREAGTWLLTAGAVCFPTRWDLPAQLGRSLAEIHGRVPGYAGAVSRSADRFFDAIPAGEIFWRSNWSLVDDPALFQPGGKLRSRPNLDIDARNAGDRVQVRVERQTLRRLPHTGGVLFTIRVLRTPLGALAARPDRARALVESLRTMSNAFLLYKSFPPIRDAVFGFLEGIAGDCNRDI